MCGRTFSCLGSFLVRRVDPLCVCVQFRDGLYLDIRLLPDSVTLRESPTTSLTNGSDPLSQFPSSRIRLCASPSGCPSSSPSSFHGRAC
ncbi:hypothetical protein V8E55_007028 [Tylopilus felleus]